MILLAFVVLFCASLALCLAMRRHSMQLMPSREYSPALALCLRILGSALLIGGAVICAVDQGPGVGLTTFFGLWCMAVLSIAVALPYLARSKR